MSRLTGRLLSAALTAGTALAVGYGLKKLGEKAIEQATAPQEDTQPEILGTAASKISLRREAGSSWRYTMRSKGIVKESENTRAGAVQHFDFVPLKDGVTELEFDYTPQGSDTPAQTITYNIEVKGGKIVRCNAAGDLEMLEKDRKDT